ncbi:MULTISPECIES: porin family protein [unclassified Methylobacterium]|uniref:outer membrane protein n=1 Tax=unclassified Methylobacterium TaxID=2615210 RepID=UPI000B20382C|nr:MULTISPECIES: porin family protein [unclassified Methylobacterium]MCK2054201.1 porin family protein [Methylobacterium sp. 37f]
MIKKILVASTVLAGLTAAASAADLPRRAAPPVFVPVPVFTWTGFYAGFNAGYGFDTAKNQSNVFNNVFPNLDVGPSSPSQIAYSNNSNEGFTGGGQIGYNHQFTPGSGLVVGVEADAQYVDFGRSRTAAILTPGFAPAPGVTFVDPRGTAGLDYFGTVRGRVGYAFDRTLVYGTGGFAYGAGSNERSFGGYRGNDSFRTGWAAGGGIEYALPTDSFLNFFRSSAVTLKVEGLYVNLDQGNKSPGVYAVDTNNVLYRQPGFTNRNSGTEFAVVRAGLNYKFGAY